MNYEVEQLLQFVTICRLNRQLNWHLYETDKIFNLRISECDIMNGTLTNSLNKYISTTTKTKKKTLTLTQRIKVLKVSYVGLVILNYGKKLWQI